MSHVSIIFTKELEKNWQGFLFVFKCLLLISEVIIADTNIVIAISNVSMALTKEHKKNC
jgi:hypothetical protein